MDCPICGREAHDFRTVDAVRYFRCAGCGSLFAHPDFLAQVEAGTARKYESDYWESELEAARQRSFGPAIARMAEVVRLARLPMTRMVDIGSGPGFLLDALQELVPSLAARVFGIELFPPAEAYRTRHPNYRIGSIADLDGLFDGGLCIEVIEHLTPTILRGMIAQLAQKSTPGALYFFNSAQPSFVEAVDPQYLDPYRRGHVVSWSIAGARKIFEPSGFNVIELPGRDWAFLAEFGPPRTVDIDTLWSWLWRPITSNAAIASNDRFGSLFEAIGLESARCYLEAATAVSRTHWALSLQRELDETRAAAKASEPASTNSPPA
jgi:SAM-dependent methyltransferase